MSESRTPVGRLDLLLAGLEDEVLRSEPEKDVSPERLTMMRSEIETQIRANMDRVEEQEPGRGTGVPSARAWAMMIRAKERLGSWTGASPRVRMAFSGSRPKKAEKIKRSDANRGDGEPDDERR
ncbi:MAG: hypothetical protein OXH52_14765 [Gammaproteobacteria bacterium]|nr:hypothetical protein [Gammaproteobacteria bacterium]